MTIMTKSAKKLTLGQIQKKLGIPQHTLIHLCEKGVISPDFGDTEGRGQFRLFSKRNLYEFAIATQIRSLKLPVLITKHILEVLRRFEKKLQKKVKGFKLEDLSNSDTEFQVFIEDDSISFVLGNGSKRKLHVSYKYKTNISKENSKTKNIVVSKYTDKIPDSYKTQLRLNVSKIIKSLK